jgi:PPK2 family polyphosphate:nucleotide phosphotransferase
MKIQSDDFKVSPEKKFRLKDWSTHVPHLTKSKEQYKKILTAQVEELSAQQRLLYASNTHSLLLIFQGMDAAGKDGSIRHVMSGVNPQGCQVFSFKVPTSEDLQHDFLWPAAQRLPERGRIGIFNRSYFEEVLTVRVHPKLLENRALPVVGFHDEKFWKSRFESIAAFEHHLVLNGTRIVKIFLHMSKEEQRKRLLERIENPEKSWKLEPSDVRDRSHWKKYTTAYEKCIAETNSKNAPWFVVPADDKETARLIISQVVIDALKSLGLSYPKASSKKLKALKAARKSL